MRFCVLVTDFIWTFILYYVRLLLITGYWNNGSVFYQWTLWTGAYWCNQLKWNKLYLFHFNLLHRVHQFREFSDEEQTSYVIRDSFSEDKLLIPHVASIYNSWLRLPFSVARKLSTFLYWYTRVVWKVFLT